MKDFPMAYPGFKDLSGGERCNICGFGKGEGERRTVEKEEERMAIKSNSTVFTDQTLLYVASRFGHLPIVEWLVTDAGCDVNIQNRKDASTPCHGAAWGFTQGVKGCKEVSFCFNMGLI
jgi:hypothetical protein